MVMLTNHSLIILFLLGECMVGECICICICICMKKITGVYFHEGLLFYISKYCSSQAASGGGRVWYFLFRLPAVLIFAKSYRDTFLSWRRCFLLVCDAWWPSTAAGRCRYYWIGTPNILANGRNATMSRCTAVLNSLNGKLLVFQP